MPAQVSITFSARLLQRVRRLAAHDTVSLDCHRKRYQTISNCCKPCVFWQNMITWVLHFLIRLMLKLNIVLVPVPG